MAFDAPEIKHRRTAEDNIDHNKTCSYRYRGETCNLPGSMAHGTKGEGPWFCRGHFRGMLPETSQRKPWSDKLIDSMIKQEDCIQPGESRTAYKERMMARVYEAIGKMTTLPYDKEERMAIQQEEIL